MTEYIVIKVDENGIFRGIEDDIGNTVYIGTECSNGNIKIDIEELLDQEYFKDLINERIEETCHLCYCQQCADFEEEIWELKEKIKKKDI